MTTDLRELLKEARDELNATLNIQGSPDLKRFIERIDAALSEPAPEPKNWKCPDCGSLTIEWAEPPPASPADARDAARLRAVLKEYDSIVEAISPEARERDGRETDFVIRLGDYEILRKAAIEREGGA